MANLQLTQVYLDPNQKAALSKKAKAAKVGVSEVIRDAVDAYLAGITVDELRLLDSASKQAAAELDAMTQQLKATNARLDNAFRAIAVMQAKAAA
jgi:Ribbon-helix-helix protein, copG family